MRKQFSERLHHEMGIHKDIFLLTGDLGYGLWDRIRIDYPNRFYNVGSSEQLMMGMAAGLAGLGSALNNPALAAAINQIGAKPTMPEITPPPGGFFPGLINA